MTGSDGSRIMSDAHAQVEIERLRAENAELRKALRKNSRHSRRIQRAFDSGMQLALWHLAYLDTSRSAATSYGMAWRQWESGTTMLKLARVIVGQRWVKHDLTTIEAALQKAADRAAADPEAFFLRGPRHMRAMRGGVSK